MRPKIYKYQHNNETYYAEGYEETSIRLTLENYLRLKSGSLLEGKSPDFKTELQLIWDRRNTTHVLTLKKEQTTSRKQLSLFKQKQHCVYELRLLLSENETFISGTQGDVIANENNNVKFWNSKYIKSNGDEVGWEMCYSFQDSTDPSETEKIYRFKNIHLAYDYVRSEIIKLGIEEEPFNKNFTNLEMCDSFTAGFGNPDLVGNPPTLN